MDHPSAEQQAEQHRKTIANLHEDAVTFEEVQTLLGTLKSKTARNSRVTNEVEHAQTSVKNAQRTAERTLRILEAGFPLVEKPEGWLEGFPAPDPRPHARTTPRWTIVVSLILFPILYISAIWFIQTLTEWEWSFTDERILIFGLSLPTAIAFFLGGFLRREASRPFRENNEQALLGAGLPTNAKRFLPYPTEAASAAASAKSAGYFDVVLAVAPPETFHQTTGPFWILGVRTGKKFSSTTSRFLIYKHTG